MSSTRHQHKTIRLIPLSLFSTLILATPAVFAAAPQVPNYGISNAVKDAAPPQGPNAPARQESPPAPVILQQDEKPMSLPDGQTIAIRDFRVEGAEFLDAQEVSAALEPYRNRELTMINIDEAANRLTVLARSRGYLVARAYVPKQDAQQGVLLIKVIAGRYGSFQMKNSSLVRDSMLQSVFDKSKEASAVVTRDSLERAMLLVNDMPGASLPLVSIAPGREPGTSDFLVDTPAENRLAGYAYVDNYGSRFTGKNRVTAGLDINSPFGIGDRLSVNGITSKAAGLQNARGAYSFPLSHDGLRGEIAASRTTYKLGDQYADLDATGTANTVEATISYPLKRTREDSVYLSFNAASRHLRDDIAVAETSVAKRDNVATLKLQRETYGTLFGFNSYSSLSGGLSFGRLSFEDAAERAANKAGADTAGSYSKANVSFLGNLAFDTKWSLATSVQVQQAFGKNLDGVEQLSLSGPSGIKSYPDGVLGDSGYMLGAELKYALPPVASFNHTVGVFADYGNVRPADGSYTTVGRIDISDVGFSYSVSGKTFFGNFQLAKTLGNRQETRMYNHDLKVLAMAGMRF